MANTISTISTKSSSVPSQGTTNRSISNQGANEAIKKAMDAVAAKWAAEAAIKAAQAFIKKPPNINTSIIAENQISLDIQDPKQLELLYPDVAAKLEEIKIQQFSSGEEIATALAAAGFDISEELANSIYLTSTQPAAAEAAMFEEFTHPGEEWRSTTIDRNRGRSLVDTGKPWLVNEPKINYPVPALVSGETVLAQLQSSDSPLILGFSENSEKLIDGLEVTEPSLRWICIAGPINSYLTEVLGEFVQAKPFEEFLSDFLTVYMPNQLDVELGEYGEQFPETDSRFAIDAWAWVAEQATESAGGLGVGAAASAVAAWLRENGIESPIVDLKIELGADATPLEQLRYNYSTDVPLADQLQALGIDAGNPEIQSVLNWAMGSETPSWEEIQFKVAAGVLNLDATQASDVVDLTAAANLAINGGTISYADNAAVLDPAAVMFTPAQNGDAFWSAEDFLNHLKTTSEAVGMPLGIDSSQLNLLMHENATTVGDAADPVPLLSPDTLATLVADGNVTPFLSEAGEMSLRIADPSKCLMNAIVNAPGDQEFDAGQAKQFLAQLLGNAENGVLIPDEQMDAITKAASGGSNTLTREQLASAVGTDVIQAVVNDVTGAITVQSNQSYSQLDGSYAISGSIFAGFVQTPIPKPAAGGVRTTMKDAATNNTELKVGRLTFTVEDVGDGKFALKDQSGMTFGTYDGETVMARASTYEADFGVQAGISGNFYNSEFDPESTADVSVNGFTRLKLFDTLQLFQPNKNDSGETIGWNTLRIRTYHGVADATYGTQIDLDGEMPADGANIGGGVGVTPLDVRWGYVSGPNLPVPVKPANPDNAGPMNFTSVGNTAAGNGAVLNEWGISIPLRFGTGGDLTSKPDWTGVNLSGIAVTYYRFGLHTVSNTALEMAQNVLNIPKNASSEQAQQIASNAPLGERIFAGAINLFGQAFEHTAVVGSVNLLGLPINITDHSQSQEPLARSAFQATSAAEEVSASDASNSPDISSIDDLFGFMSSADPNEFSSLMNDGVESLGLNPDDVAAYADGLGQFEGTIEATRSFVNDNVEFINLINTAKDKIQIIYNATTMLSGGETLAEGKVDDVISRAVEIAFESILSQQVIDNGNGNFEQNQQYGLTKLQNESDTAFAARLFANVGKEMVTALPRAFAELVEIPLPDTDTDTPRFQWPQLTGAGIAGLVSGLGGVLAGIGGAIGTALALGKGDTGANSDDTESSTTSPYYGVATALTDAAAVLDQTVTILDNQDYSLFDSESLVEALASINVSIEWMENEAILNKDEEHEILYSALVAVKDAMVEILMLEPLILWLIDNNLPEEWTDTTDDGPESGGYEYDPIYGPEWDLPYGDEGVVVLPVEPGDEGTPIDRPEWDGPIELDNEGMPIRE